MDFFSLDHRITDQSLAVQIFSVHIHCADLMVFIGIIIIDSLCHITAGSIQCDLILPLEDKVFTRELWESATECPVVFPDGVGVVPWMVPGGRAIAVKTAELMKKYDVVIWAHHGMFCSGEDFDLTFGLLHTVEKSAEILVKILSMVPHKLQTIQPDNFRDLAKDFHVTLPEEFLYEKE